MKITSFLLGILLIISLPTMAQYKTAVFNYKHAYFDDGQPLPAENKFIIFSETGPN